MSRIIIASCIKFPPIQFQLLYGLLKFCVNFTLLVGNVVAYKRAFEIKGGNPVTMSQIEK